MRAVARFPPPPGPSIVRSLVSTGAARICFFLLFLCGVLSASLLFSPIAAAQQTQLKRYDLYVGFADLNSPALGLNQTGVHTQFGVNERSWYALGFDYSGSSGSTVLKPDLLRSRSSWLLSSRPTSRPG